MPASLEPKRPDTREKGPEPLRRRRVQPLTGGSTARRGVITALLAFATIVLLVDALVGDRGFVERLRARRQHQKAEASLTALRRENAVMHEEIRRLRDDPSLIESLAREELGLIRPGELLFIVRDARPASR